MLRTCECSSKMPSKSFSFTSSEIKLFYAKRLGVTAVILKIKIMGEIGRSKESAGTVVYKTADTVFEKACGDSFSVFLTLSNISHKYRPLPHLPTFIYCVSKLRRPSSNPLTFFKKNWSLLL
jgi:hypothetical protein